MNKRTRVRVSKVLGKGSFGTVYEAERVSDGFKCAAKIALVDRRTDPASFMTESLMGMLTRGKPHPRIVSFFGLGKRENEDTGDHFFEVVLLMELVPGGSLLHAMKGEPFQERRARKFVCQVLEGLCHLHFHLNVIHRDIKPGNVLLTAEDDVKIADLGGSIFVVDGNADSFTGTPFYMAPEVLKRETYTNKVDVFSTGCLLVHMLTGKTPFLNSYVNELSYVYKMRNDNLILEVPNGPWETQSMNHFISCMVQIDPKLRADVKQLLAHEAMKANVELAEPSELADISRKDVPSPEDEDDCMELETANASTATDGDFGRRGRLRRGHKWRTRGVEREDEAAVKIQSRVRGMVQRKTVDCRSRREEGAGRGGRRRNEEEQETTKSEEGDGALLEEAAVKIQSRIRGAVTRKRVDARRTRGEYRGRWGARARRTEDDRADEARAMGSIAESEVELPELTVSHSVTAGRKSSAPFPDSPTGADSCGSGRRSGDEEMAAIVIERGVSHMSRRRAQRASKWRAGDTIGSGEGEADLVAARSTTACEGDASKLSREASAGSRELASDRLLMGEGEGEGGAADGDGAEVRELARNAAQVRELQESLLDMQRTILSISTRRCSSSAAPRASPGAATEMLPGSPAAQASRRRLGGAGEQAGRERRAGRGAEARGGGARGAWKGGEAKGGEEAAAVKIQSRVRGMVQRKAVDCRSRREEGAGRGGRRRRDEEETKRLEADVALLEEAAVKIQSRIRGMMERKAVGDIRTSKGRGSATRGRLRRGEELGGAAPEAGQGRSFVSRGGRAKGAARKTVSRVTCDDDGSVLGCGVWTIAAYDGDERILVVDRDYGNNKAKFGDFMKMLDAKGYALSYQQYQQLNEKLHLDICVPAMVTNSTLLNQILLYGFGKQPLSWQASANSKMLARS